MRFRTQIVFSVVVITCTSMSLLLAFGARIADDTARLHGTIRNEQQWWLLSFVVFGSLSVVSVAKCFPERHSNWLRGGEALLVTTISVLLELLVIFLSYSAFR